MSNYSSEYLNEIISNINNLPLKEQEACVAYKEMIVNVKHVNEYLETNKSTLHKPLDDEECKNILTLLKQIDGLYQVSISDSKLFISFFYDIIFFKDDITIKENDKIKALIKKYGDRFRYTRLPDKNEKRIRH